MNPTIELLLNRKSVRAYENHPIEAGTKAEILKATLRAPTAGNMMLYSILDVTDQAAKDTLVKTCDNQPFIAKSPWVLLFLADYQRWFDYFIACGVEQLCERKQSPLRKPAEGDLFLACCDALIAAQTAVIAAESFGIGSCYIGDIMENYETHRELFDLPRYVFPVSLVCFGYPTGQQKRREQPQRFARRFIVFENRYQRLDSGDFDEMFHEQQERAFKDKADMDGCANVGQLMYLRKFSANFTLEMTRSVRAMLAAWIQD